MTASLATSSSEIWREESVPGHPCMATMGTELALPMGPVWWQLGPTRGLPGWENLASACWGGTSNRRRGRPPASGSLAPEPALGDISVTRPPASRDHCPPGKGTGPQGLRLGTAVSWQGPDLVGFNKGCVRLATPGLEGKGEGRGQSKKRGLDNHERSGGLQAGQTQLGEGHTPVFLLCVPLTSPAWAPTGWNLPEARGCRCHGCCPHKGREQAGRAQAQRADRQRCPCCLPPLMAGGHPTRFQAFLPVLAVPCSTCPQQGLPRKPDQPQPCLAFAAPSAA